MLGEELREKCFPALTDGNNQDSEEMTFEFFKESFDQAVVEVFIGMSSVSYAMFKTLLESQRRKKNCVSTCKLDELVCNYKS